MEELSHSNLGVSQPKLSPEGRLQLSIIITVTSGAGLLERCLNQLDQQHVQAQYEVLVPYAEGEVNVDPLRRDYPDVRWLPMAVKLDEIKDLETRHQVYDRGKSYGLRMAQGEILALLDDTCIPDPTWVGEILQAHQLPYGAIGGVVEHAGLAVLNWAVYYQDFGRYQPPIAEGASRYLTDVNLSYKSQVLQSVSNFWFDSYNEAAVNWCLIEKGEVLWLRPQISVSIDRGELNFWSTVKERYAWGKVYGKTRASQLSPGGKVGYLAAAPGIPVLLFFRLCRKVLAGGKTSREFYRSVPLILLFLFIWVFGEWAGILSGSSLKIMEN